MEQMLYERIQIMFRILSAFRRLNSFQIIVLGFAFVILLGAGILMLPVSSADGSWTPFVKRPVYLRHLRLRDRSCGL